MIDIFSRFRGGVVSFNFVDLFDVPWLLFCLSLVWFRILIWLCYTCVLCFCVYVFGLFLGERFLRACLAHVCFACFMFSFLICDRKLKTKHALVRFLLSVSENNKTPLEWKFVFNFQVFFPLENNIFWTKTKNKTILIFSLSILYFW